MTAQPLSPESLAHGKRRSWIYLKLVLMALIWGGTFVAGRTVAQQMPLMTAAAIRFAIAVPMLVLIAWRLEGGLPRLNSGQVVTTFFLGLTGIFTYNLCFFIALSYMPASRTALFGALNPVVTALLLALLFRERLHRIGWLGIVLAFIGVAVLIARGDLAGAMRDISSAFGVGEAVMLLGVTSWAVYAIIGRFSLRGMTPIAATTYAAIWGLLQLSIAATWEWSSFDPATLDLGLIGALIYLGVFGTAIGFIWYYEGVKEIGPARTAVFNNLVPVFGVLLAALLLSEPILISMIVGGALVILGVTLTNLQPVIPRRRR